MNEAIETGESEELGLIGWLVIAAAAGAGLYFITKKKPASSPSLPKAPAPQGMRLMSSSVLSDYFTTPGLASADQMSKVAYDYLKRLRDVQLMAAEDNAKRGGKFDPSEFYVPDLESEYSSIDQMPKLQAAIVHYQWKNDKTIPDPQDPKSLSVVLYNETIDSLANLLKQSVDQYGLRQHGPLPL